MNWCYKKTLWKINCKKFKSDFWNSCKYRVTETRCRWKAVVVILAISKKESEN